MKKYLWIYFTCVIVVGVFVWVYVNFSKRLVTLQAAEDVTTHSYQVINSLEKIENTLLDAETGQRGFLITGDSSFLKSYNNASDHVLQLLDSLKVLINDNVIQLNNVILLKATVNMRFQYLSETLEKKKMNDAVGIKEKIDLGQKAMAEYRTEMQYIRTIELNLLSKRKLEKKQHEALTIPKFKLVFFTSGFFLIASIVIMLNELRRRIQSEKTLQIKVTELNIKNEEIEQYTFVASHALQEPLRKIRTFSSMLLQKQKDKLNTEQTHVLERMEAATGSMQNMLTDLIALTNLINKKQIAKPVNLNEVIIGVIQKLAADKSNELPIINVAELPVILGVPEQLEILFTQLFDNSIKFQSAEEKLAISISVKKSSKFLHLFKTYHTILFTDNGLGFNDDYKTKIFQLFQKLDTDTAQPGKGTGLTICKKIMLNHSGTIDAESTEGKGTTILLNFPKI